MSGLQITPGMCGAPGSCPRGQGEELPVLPRSPWGRAGPRHLGDGHVTEGTRLAFTHTAHPEGWAS